MSKVEVPSSTDHLLKNESSLSYFHAICCFLFLKSSLVASSTPLNHCVWLKDLQGLWCPPNVADRVTGSRMPPPIKPWKESELRGALCPHLSFHTSQPREREGLTGRQIKRTHVAARARKKLKALEECCCFLFNEQEAKRCKLQIRKNVIKMWKNSLSRSHTPDFPHAHISFPKTSCLSDGKLVRRWYRKFGLLAGWRVLWISERFVRVCLLASRSNLKCD